MIPWVRGKFAERRARWIAARKQIQQQSPPQSPSPSITSPQNGSSTLTNHQNKFLGGSGGGCNGSSSNSSGDGGGNGGNDDSIGGPSDLVNIENGKIIKFPTWQFDSESKSNRHKDHRNHHQHHHHHHHHHHHNHNNHHQNHNNEQNHTNVNKLKIIVFNSDGKQITLVLSHTVTGKQVKLASLRSFIRSRNCHANNHDIFDSIDNDYDEDDDDDDDYRVENQSIMLINESRKYRLLKARIQFEIDENISLAESNVQNNDEFLLIKCVKKTDTTMTSAFLLPIQFTSESPSSLNLAINSILSPAAAAVATAAAAVATTATATGTTTTVVVASATATVGVAGAAAAASGAGTSSSTSIIPTVLTFDYLKGPTQADIELNTRHLPAHKRITIPIVNIEELVLQSDVQFDIRQILISLAETSAYVIGTGPHAKRLIFMLKQRLISKKCHETDALQLLVDMGFSRSKSIHALRLHNNIYVAALNWLIDNQNSSLDIVGTPTSTIETSIATSGSGSTAATNEQTFFPTTPTQSLYSSIFLNLNSSRENIEALLVIIRIYCQKDIPPSIEMVRLIKDMGFAERDVIEALKITKNNHSAACDWLIGNRTKTLSKIMNSSGIDGLPIDSPILRALLQSPHVQLSLSNPKIFIAYLSILEDYSSMNMWLGDSETSGIIGHILRTYHEEKHILAINQFSSLL